MLPTPRGFVERVRGAEVTFCAPFVTCLRGCGLASKTGLDRGPVKRGIS